MNTTMQSQKKILIIGGPTASGKSSAAIECAKHFFCSEIISCDSAQVYKYMDIGTAKPTTEEMQGIKHHLIDFVLPDYNYTAANYKSDCKIAVDSIFAKDGLPIICGGTGLYLNSFLFDYNLGNCAENAKLRYELSILYDVKGSDFMHNLLKKCDIDAASRLHKNDKKRIVRALEICFSAKDSYTVKKNAATQQSSKYNYVFVVLTCDRQKLYSKIDSRVEEMIKKGLFEEVEKLLALGYGMQHKSMSAIGYKESYQYICGNINRQTAIDMIKQNTRNYAKRQITWFKSQKNVVFIDTEHTPINKIIELL